MLSTYQILVSDQTWYVGCDLNGRVDSVRLEVLLDAGGAFHDLALADETGGLGGWGVEAVTAMTLVVVLKTGVGLSNVDVESCFRRKLRPAILILAAVFSARTGHQLNSILLTFQNKGLVLRKCHFNKCDIKVCVSCS